MYNVLLIIFSYIFTVRESTFRKYRNREHMKHRWISQGLLNYGSAVVKFHTNCDGSSCSPGTHRAAARRQSCLTDGIPWMGVRPSIGCPFFHLGWAKWSRRWDPGTSQSKALHWKISHGKAHCLAMAPGSKFPLCYPSTGLRHVWQSPTPLRQRFPCLLCWPGATSQALEAYKMKGLLRLRYSKYAKLDGGRAEEWED